MQPPNGKLRHTIRNTLLTLAYAHPAAMAVAIRRGPTAAKDYLAEIYRCSKTDAGLHLPIVKVDDLVKEEVAISLVRPPAWYGSMTVTEIASLCMLVAARRPKKILEIGSFQGLTTLTLALNAPPATVHTLDLPPETSPTQTKFENADAAIIGRRGHYFYAGRPEASRIRQHFGDSASFDYSSIGGEVDVALIDAAHSYDYVRNDTAKVLPLMARDGLILWHDYGRNDFMTAPEDAWGVTHFLHELSTAGVRILQGTSLGVLPLDTASLDRLREMVGRDR